MAKILDLVTNAGQVDVTKGIVEEVVKVVPEIAFFDAGTIPGTTLSTLARTSLPTVAFRKIGDPVSSSRSGFAKRTVELALLSGRVEVSEAEAFANPIASLEEQEVDEANAVLIAAFKHLAKQIWYGAKSGKGDSKGFDGCVDLVDAALVTKAGNGTAGANTSVWLVGNGFKTKLGLAFSQNSKILSASDLEFHKGDILIKNGATVTGVEPGYIGDLTSWAGLHLANKNALARLCNVTTTTGLTDDMLTDAIEAYTQANDGIRPDAIFMSYNARKMLRKSRTLTFTSKKGVDVTQSAPIPTDMDGIPIIATNAILNTEATVTDGESGQSDAA